MKEEKEEKLKKENSKKELLKVKDKRKVKRKKSTSDLIAYEISDPEKLKLLNELEMYGKDRSRSCQDLRKKVKHITFFEKNENKKDSLQFKEWEKNFAKHRKNDFDFDKTKIIVETFFELKTNQDITEISIWSSETLLTKYFLEVVTEYLNDKIDQFFNQENNEDDDVKLNLIKSVFDLLAKLPISDEKKKNIENHFSIVVFSKTNNNFTEKSFKLMGEYQNWSSQENKEKGLVPFNQ